MIFSRVRSLALLSLVLLISGCNLFNTQTQQNPADKKIDEKLWLQHQQKIMALSTWQVDGKVGIRAEQSSGSATLFWLQQFDYYDIRLSGPLGFKASRITGQKGKVTLEVSGQGRYTATTPEALLQQQLNWDLPISHLAWWIKGLPAPDTPYTTTLNKDNRLQTLQQDQWSIEYKTYQNYGEYWLPEKIIAKSATMQVTLVAKHWTIRVMGKEIAAN